MDVIKFEQIADLYKAVGDKFLAKKEELCAMDAKLGDGDLGLTMSKGFSSLPEIINNEAAGVAGDAGKLIMKAGMKMSSLVPSTMGFLMSSGLMEGGKAIKGLNEIDGPAMAKYLAGYAAGIKKRGKCEAGQRTIYDAFITAANKATALVEANPQATLKEVIDAAYEGAKEGVEATKTMVPVFGKAAVHAAQAAGVEDQGAVAGCYKIEAMKEFINQ